MRVSEEESKGFYQQNLQNYQLPERVRAAHILFKTEGKSPEEVEKIRNKATEVLLQAKKGEDFATLAKKYSEDGSAANGGDLGFFGRGQMVLPFENAAFTLGVGAISDLVTTKFGFHIIKVLEKQPAHTQGFDEVAHLIRPSLLQRKADQATQELADRAFSRIRNNQSLEQVSRELALPIQETPYCAQGAAIPGIGSSPELSSKVFGLKTKEIGSPVRVPNGFAIAQVMEVQAPRIPELSEVRAKVEQDLKAFRAVDIAKSKAEEFVDKVRAGANFETLAKSYGVTAKSSEDFIEGFAFSANLGDVNQPVQIGQKQAVVQLKGRNPISPEEFAKVKNNIRESLLSQKKEQVFQAHVEHLRDKMMKAGKIKINDALFAEISRRF